MRLVPAKSRGTPDYRGTVLVNPGGPGDSGTFLIAEAGKSLARVVGDSFDVLGFDPRRRAWKAAADYTTQLAGLLWCARALLLEAAFEGQPDDVEAVEVEAVEHFRAAHRMWLADGSHTPVSTIVRWMAYGKGHRRLEGGAPRVLWEAGTGAGPGTNGRGGRGANPTVSCRRRAQVRAGLADGRRGLRTGMP